MPSTNKINQAVLSSHAGGGLVVARSEDWTPSEQAEIREEASKQFSVYLPVDDADKTIKFPPNKYQNCAQLRRVYHLLDAVLADEVADSNVVAESDPETLQAVCMTFYCQMGEELADALIAGDLPRQLRRQSRVGLRKQVESLTTDGCLHPAIYSNWLVTAEGYGPTPREFGLWLSTMQGYLDGDAEIVRRTDLRQQRQHSEVRFQRYLQKKGQESVPERHETLQEFIRRGQELKATIPTELWDLPMKPFREIGWAMDPASRLKNHEKAQSSNYIMQILLDIAEWLFPRKFTLEQYILLIIIGRERAVLGEIFTTRICQGYVEDVVGLSHWRAGKNNSRAQQLPEQRLKNARGFVERHCKVAETNQMMAKMNKVAEDLDKHRQVAKELAIRTVVESRRRAEQKKRFAKKSATLVASVQRACKILKVIRTFDMLRELDEEFPLPVADDEDGSGPELGDNLDELSADDIFDTSRQFITGQDLTRTSPAISVRKRLVEVADSDKHPNKRLRLEVSDSDSLPATGEDESMRDYDDEQSGDSNHEYAVPTAAEVAASEREASDDSSDSESSSDSSGLAAFRIQFLETHHSEPDEEYEHESASENSVDIVRAPGSRSRRRR